MSKSEESRCACAGSVVVEVENKVEEHDQGGNVTAGGQEQAP